MRSTGPFSVDTRRLQPLIAVMDRHGDIVATFPSGRVDDAYLLVEAERLAAWQDTQDLLVEVICLPAATTYSTRMRSGERRTAQWFMQRQIPSITALRIQVEGDAPMALGQVQLADRLLRPPDLVLLPHTVPLADPVLCVPAGVMLTAYLERV